MRFNFLISFCSLIFPWRIRKILLVKLLGYKIHSSAKIGYSLVYPYALEMGEGATIGHLTCCRNIDLLKMEKKSIIGNFNWIGGIPSLDKRFFSSQSERCPELIISEHSAITSRHLIDCTDSVHIGSFSIIAGYRSQILTHSVDINEARQYSFPVSIGDYCFVGTSSTLLAGSTLPNYSILGASSLLNKKYQIEYTLYAGVPAKPKKTLSKEWNYFLRKTGFIN